LWSNSKEKYGKSGSKGIKVNIYYYSEFLTAMDERDPTIGKGFVFNGKHFDVHRFHVPLVYGRRGGPDGGPDESEGICLARIKNQDKIYYMVITYVLPIVSPRAISLIPEFLTENQCKQSFNLVGALDE